MMRLLYGLGIILLLEFIFQSCANPVAPTGGPKDSIPPKLIYSFPEDQSLNFDETTIVLEFDEFIAADKLQQSLIITPITDNKFKHLIKKRTLTLKFDKPFEDSTTYTLNFFDGVTDITERNPVENLIIAFSTGNYIDSLYLFGNIKSIDLNKPEDDIIIGLYRITDSLDLFTDKPTYFITTDDNGEFRIQNIKQNKYRLFAFGDENNNLLFDANESYSFINDTLHITESLEDSILLSSIKVNAAKLNLISARPSSHYFDVRYSKPISKYSIQHPNRETKIASDFTGEGESIRIYNSFNISSKDSIMTILTVYDSIQNSVTDTLYVKFTESSRKKEEYKVNLSPQRSKPVFPATTFNLDFNKPTSILDSSFATIRIDTLIDIPLSFEKVYWNHNETNLSFQFKDLESKRILDSIQSFQKSLIGDSTDVDSVDLLLYKHLERFTGNKFILSIKPNAFKSVENDTAKAIQTNYSFAKKDDFGLITVSIDTDKPSYFVQLMQKDKVINQQENCSKCVFNNINSGNYWFRILIDENQDGYWTIGNIHENVEPEPVIYFKEETTIRANWENQLQFSF